MSRVLSTIFDIDFPVEALPAKSRDDENERVVELYSSRVGSIAPTPGIFVKSTTKESRKAEINFGS